MVGPRPLPSNTKIRTLPAMASSSAVADYIPFYYHISYYLVKTLKWNLHRIRDLTDSLEFRARLLPIRYLFQDSLEFRARLSSIRYRFQDSLEFWARLIPV